ncbi:hypothetical protein I6N95_08645 [Vagococcus sp. BWB3-3]|uniref:Uncharacterized protein n=1 Tax=Vagococcus allomyrinae TaxID=2794353 RepID=A0A940SUQ7_9ENTE|nr:hypothetical protein [Vagococcus allomyrinae]MBP1041069.1 hypothetical protein [Vagococcus allomyrinae]
MAKNERLVKDKDSLNVSESHATDRCEFKKIGLLVPFIGIICGILVQFFY